MNEIVILVIFLSDKEQYKAFVEDASFKSILNLQTYDETAEEALNKLILILQSKYMTKGDTYRLVINKSTRTVMYYQHR